MSERDQSFPVRGVDPERVFLDEVARLLPDVDVVAVRAPRPSDAPEPTAELAQQRAATAREVAVEELSAAWPVAFPDLARPGPVTVKWTQSQFLDGVAAEAMVRAPGQAAAASAAIDSIELALGDAGWTCTRRDPSGDGDRRIVGLDDDDRVIVDLVVLQVPDVVLMRVRTAEVVVGRRRAIELVDALPTVVDVPA